MRRRSLALLALLALTGVALAPACGPDPEPLECNGAPDFEVLVSAADEDAPLPADTVLRLYYGGRAPDDPEVLTLSDPQTPQALFCYVSTRDRAYDPTSPALGSSASTTGSAGAGGEGGGGGAAGPIEALFCRLWTDGGARLEVTTQLYGTSSLELALNKGVCTVQSELLLEPMDAGM